MIRDEIGKTGHPPSGLQIVPLSQSDDLWKFLWDVQSIAYYETSDIRVFAGLVGVKTPQSPKAEPTRWVMIFRRTAQKWEDITINYPGFTSAPGARTLSPLQMPITLRTIMGLEPLPS
jgi:hypothetical protein